jgi:tetraacyldisaccharide 4'-kinase
MMRSVQPMRTLAQSLEEGHYRGPVARALSSAWARASARTVVRTLVLPARVTTVAVGGATLGGSGKTPLAIACARELARGGVRVALVGHAYRGAPGRARQVHPDDAVEVVGDEAIVAARALEPHGVSVVVAPRRAAALELAAREADVLVIDGLLQAAPRRVSLSLLAVDVEEPWGRAVAVPPLGDLRAPVAALLEATDRVVSVGDDPADARIASRGARLGVALLEWDTLRPLRIGLACALARPDRIVRFLQRRGIRPVALARGRDHGPMPQRALDRTVDLWIATPKCALHVAPLRAPLATLDHDLVLAPSVSALLASARAP